jgi:PPK2 family polyphosphate:nucleotide phosphotransferase
MASDPLKRFRIDSARAVQWTALRPQNKPLSSGDKARDLAQIEALGAELSRLQDRLFAAGGPALLLVLQGMDTSGKDGTIRTVFRHIDPLGVRCVSYRAPVGPESERDFLWRHHRDVPGRGEIVIFNRSHYEAVLIEYVHGWIDRAERDRRLEHIVAFERLLADSGTAIVKCFLHISKAEQRERLQERIDDPRKHWKFDRKDLEERARWPRYQSAYRAALEATGRPHAPWYVIPADSKTHRNLMVSRILCETLRRLVPDEPRADPSLKGLVVT